MNLVNLLRALHEGGSSLILRDADIACWHPEGSSIPQEVRLAILFWRPELLELLLKNEVRCRLKSCLSPDCTKAKCITADQWQAFEERAAILISDGTISRTWSEVIAAIEGGLLTDANAGIQGDERGA